MTTDITLAENIIDLMSRNPTSDKIQRKVRLWTNFKSTYGFFSQLERHVTNISNGM